MIPKEVTDALESITDVAYGGTTKYQEVEKRYKIIKNFLETTDRYVKELEQHVDDLAASQHGVAEDD